MEEDTKAFLIRILNTISIVLLWMMVNVIAGIYLGYGFFEGKPDWKNYTYYLFFLSSFISLIIHLKRKWKV
jgi:ABC-type spermidine/putrescine transport system permease subunit I